MILIDMKLPRNCTECPLREYGHCKANNNMPVVNYKNERDRMCPLHPLRPDQEENNVYNS